MYVIPLKWLPYGFVIVGAVYIIGGDPAGISMFFIGAIWLFIKYYLKSQKNNQRTNHTSSTQQNIVKNNTVNRTTQITNQTNNEVKKTTTTSQRMIKCPNCYEPLELDSIFCSNCGKKIK